MTPRSCICAILRKYDTRKECSGFERYIWECISLNTVSMTVIDWLSSYNGAYLWHGPRLLLALCIRKCLKNSDSGKKLILLCVKFAGHQFFFCFFLIDSQITLAESAVLIWRIMKAGSGDGPLLGHPYIYACIINCSFGMKLNINCACWIQC